MTSPSAAGFDVTPRPREREAKRLAGLLRESRLTLIYEGPDGGLTSLLQTGILPRLCRRRGDLVLGRAAQTTHRTLLPDRRSDGGPAERRSEVAVYVDAWSGSPIAKLQERIAESLAAGGVDAAVAASPLAESLAAWSRRLDARFLIIFDRFEEYLRAPFDGSGVRELAEQWVQILEQPGLPVNFLIGMRSDARPLMDQFAERISGFGQYGSSLPRLWNANFMVFGKRAAEVGAKPLPITQSRAAPNFQPPPSAPVRAQPRRLTGSRSKRFGDWRLISVALALLLLAATAEFDRQLEAKRQQASSTASAGSTPAPGAAPIPPVRIHAVLLADADNATDDRIAREFAKIVVSASGGDLSVRPLRGLAGRASEAALPRLAIVPNSTLREAKLATLAKRTDQTMQVVTPLYAGEMYFIARASSPLSFIHEIRGWEINIGPPSGTRAANAQLAYREMFDVPMPKTTSSNDEVQEAMRKLVDDEGVDVVVLVAPQPAFWHSLVTAQIGHAIKLLKLDRGNPASLRALQSFVPTTVHATAEFPWRGPDMETLAVMSFLVALDPPSHAEDSLLRGVAQALCANLPALRLNGDPKWRQVQLGSQPEAGWPYSRPAQAAFRACGEPPAAPSAQHASSNGAFFPFLDSPSTQALARDRWEFSQSHGTAMAPASRSPIAP